MRKALAALLTLMLAACSGEPALEPAFHAEENPELLSSWGQVGVAGGRLQLAAHVTPYDLATPLFSDYARKLRTVWMPEGTSAGYREGEVFDFPVGTVITKTFYYPISENGKTDEVLKQTSTIPLQEDALPLADIRLVETRLLVRREKGWVALPYVWNDEQTDAVLQRTGDLQRMTLAADTGNQEFVYVVPDANQCAGCHATNNTTRQIQPIGPAPRHLNRDFPYVAGVENQLAYWGKAGLVSEGPAPQTAPQNALWGDTSASLDARARAYLDINCAHCHNVAGPADTSGLHLEPWTPQGPSLGICKLPVAAGSGTGDRLYDIHPGKPDDSIFVYRMASTDPAAMMPELGRALAHEEGVALIAEWIAELEGGCG